MTSYERITVAARVFSVAAILGLVLLTGDLVAVQAGILLAVMAGASTFAATRVQQQWVAGFEAVFIGLLIGLMLPSSSGLLLLPYLVVPALSAGLSAGLLGLLLITSLELSCVLLFAFVPSGRQALAPIVTTLGPWFLTSAGVGLLGVWLRNFTKVLPADTSYEAARRLLSQLRTVARRLSAGLDTGSMGMQLLHAVNDHLETIRSAVFIRTDGGVLTPIGYHGADAREHLQPDDLVVAASWTEMEPTTLAQPLDTAPLIRTVLPLRVGTTIFGVVILDQVGAPSKDQVSLVMKEVDEHSLRLHTALTFDEVRAVATREERHRLAREIHDGVAQEIASLGYLVDDISAHANTVEQRQRLVELRAELTRVVGELRHSIFDLRSEVSLSTGLGSVLTDYVREVGARSGITVHLTLDESPTRLRAEVETEMLRIAQEAISNARKHSNAENLWVDCRIRPPFARISVRDDGNGLIVPRDGSYGLKIMRERAARIDAILDVIPTSERGSGGGATIIVTVGGELRLPECEN